jgi:hypothetical protein
LNIKRNIKYFSYITFEHVYRDRNQEADYLSKVGLATNRGSSKIYKKD